MKNITLNFSLSLLLLFSSNYSFSQTYIGVNLKSMNAIGTSSANGYHAQPCTDINAEFFAERLTKRNIMYRLGFQGFNTQSQFSPNGKMLNYDDVWLRISLTRSYVHSLGTGKLLYGSGLYTAHLAQRDVYSKSDAGYKDEYTASGNGSFSVGLITGVRYMLPVHEAKTKGKQLLTVGLDLGLDLWQRNNVADPLNKFMFQTFYLGYEFDLKRR
ncbi:MAG: hypothetical protein GC181_09135 [Bacteroidetes bacterium]|nr:hypothetical protein [Bacteroidota bacterium]